MQEPPDPTAASSSQADVESLQRQRRARQQEILDHLYDITGGISDEPVHPLNENKRALLPQIIKDLEKELHLVQSQILKVETVVHTAEGPLRAYQRDYDDKQKEYQRRAEDTDEHDKYAISLKKEAEKSKEAEMDKKNFDNLDYAGRTELLAEVFEFEEIDKIEAPIRPVRHKLGTLLPFQIERIQLSHALNRAIAFQEITDHSIANGLLEVVHNLEEISANSHDPAIRDNLHDTQFIAKHVHGQQVHDLPNGALLVNALVVKTNIMNAGGFMMPPEDCLVACEIKNEDGKGFQIFRVSPSQQAQLENQALAQLGRTEIQTGDRLTFVVHDQSEYKAPEIKTVVNKFPIHEFSKSDKTVNTIYLGRDKNHRMLVAQKVPDGGYVKILRTPYSQETLLSQDADSPSQFENLTPGKPLSFKTPLTWKRNPNDKTEAEIILAATNNGTIRDSFIATAPKDLGEVEALYIGPGKGKGLRFALHIEGHIYPQIFDLPRNLQGGITDEIRKNLTPGDRLSVEPKEHRFIKKIINNLSSKKIKK